MVIVQNKNKMVKPLDNADIEFIISATLDVSGAKRVNILPRIWKSGAPGG
jgi:hypothetical protein